MTINSRTPFGFGLIDFNSDNWHEDEWYNWRLLDALLDADLGDTALPVVGGTATAITLDYTPNKTLANGLTLQFILTASPTGATTVAVDAIAAKALRILNAAVANGDLLAGDVVKAVYDSVTDAYHVISPVRKTGKITVTIGASGATVDTAADDLIIHSDLDAGISILTPANKIGTLAFGDPASGLAGAIRYNHSSDTFSILVNAVEVATWSTNGIRLDAGWFTMDLNGANDFQIKEVSNDVVRFGSSGASTGFSLTVTTGAVLFHNDVEFDGTLTIDGAVDIDAAVDISGAVTLSGVLTTSQDIVRATKGIHPFFNHASMTGGEIFVQAVGADPTANPGDIVLEY